MVLPEHLILGKTLECTTGLVNPHMHGSNHVHPGNLALVKRQSTIRTNRSQDDVMKSIDEILASLIREEIRENNCQVADSRAVSPDLPPQHVMGKDFAK